ncbi:Apolipoprotein N-acyltransferase [Marinomonas gallaica]|uniref:Apolipoprotein N-acyltransferase n=1 Tax=Marinomonas gallaica TaxID=1806667 RepID=A0A1C3JQ41_9GAMM|nr:apolipoprotein N-acyltransferase [Marinomonas gallaica]SBT17391.1 Apolipoprotein N-acyltransferase [Marinomonas gallaica]SBT19583.1 Apolipoprotein N-acyltransferase [Marinomonas gallaica]
MNINATLSTNVTGWRLRLLQSFSQHPKKQSAALFLLGALSTLSFAPFYIWPIYLLAMSYLAFAWQGAQSNKQSFAFGLSFALGLFGTGISWVYVSIANFGQVGLPIAIGITLAFITAASLYWGLAGLAYFQTMKRLPKVWAIPVFVSMIMVFEWLRSTLFTGFPWLLPGYISELNWLFELLPVGGIWLVSTIVALTAAAFAHTVFLKQHYRFAIFTLFLWVIAGYLTMTPPNYVTPNEKHSVTLVQGNVPQDEKWLAENSGPTLTYYQQATIENINSDIVVWPETAITYVLHQVKPYLKPFSEDLAKQNTTLITGVPVWDEARNGYFNGVWATGNGFGLYEKQKLVPFGEYVPLAEWFGPIFDLFGMPMSQFRKGPVNQPTLQAGELSIAPFICYEVVYPSLVRAMVRDSDILLTISNDGWFGDSIGPLQHLQIAQFRAKESGRYMIRATNTGVSAIIDEKGHISSKLPQFVRATMTGNVSTMSGNTPYVMHGNLSLWGLLLLLVMLALLPYRRSQA